MPVRNDRALYAVVGVLVTLVLLVDFEILPLGIPAWSLYLIPVVACLFAWRPSAPLVVAVVAALLNVVGYVVKTLPADPEIARIAQVNRVFGFLTLLLLGVTIRQFVQAKVKGAEDAWVAAGKNQLAARLQGELSIDELGQRALSFLAHYLGAQVGAAYVRLEGGQLRRCGTFARGGANAAPELIAPGEGLVGQAVAEGRQLALDAVPPGYAEIRSATGGVTPRALVVVPTMIDGAANGALELGFLVPPSARVRTLLDDVAQTLGTACRSARYRQRQHELLEETRRQAEELQAQQDALRAGNDKLQAANEELRSANDTLDEQGRALARTASDFERASRYKSEFLANMSHELRTPLNSLLILARLLVENQGGNLTAEQVKFAASIAASGNDLLTLINDILDLSKIEAGRIELQVEPVTIAGVLEDVRRRFAPLAADKHLELRLCVEADCPSTIETDRHRLQQILTNLVSNAVKFTEAGHVEVKVGPAPARRVAFAVADTGIGIAPEHHQGIFDAFRQADGTTSRKYGGTGLGLSISRELASLLGGDIALQSAPGSGSTFTLTVARRLAADAPREVVAAARALPVATESPVRGGTRRSVLVVEDDAVLRDALSGMLRTRGFDVAGAASAAEATAMLRAATFDCLVLDLILPDQSGLELLERSGNGEGTLPPVIVHTARNLTPDDERRLRQRARAVIVKGTSSPERLFDEVARLLHGPVGPEVSGPTARAPVAPDAALTGRRVLLVEDDIRNVFALTSMLEPRGVAIDVARTGTEALARLERAPRVDLVLMDVMLPELDGLEATKRIRQHERYRTVPIITLTAKAMPDDRDRSLAAGANDHLTKPVDGERLLTAMRTWLAS